MFSRASFSPRVCHDVAGNWCLESFASAFYGLCPGNRPLPVAGLDPILLPVECAGDLAAQPI
jgi:hypothetical protein